MSTNVNPYLIRCPACKTRNRIPAAKFGGTARCGKCRAAIPTGDVLIEQPLLVTDANFQEKFWDRPSPRSFSPGRRGVRPAARSPRSSMPLPPNPAGGCGPGN